MGRRRAGLTRARRLRLLAAIAIGSALALIGLTGWMLYDARQAAHREAEQAAGNLALSLERDIARNIEIYDLSLKNAASALNVPGLLELAPEVRQAALFDNAVTAAEFGGIAITNPAGDITYESGSAQAQPSSLSDRNWFEYLKQHPGTGLYVSLTTRMVRTGKQSLVLSRRMERSDGSFAGAVVGVIYLDYFRSLFGGLTLGEGDAIILMTTEGRIVTRRPFAAEDVGRDIASAEVFRRVRDRPYGFFEKDSSVDGVRRIYSYRRVAELPLVVQVGLSTKSVYAEWTHKAFLTTTVLAAFAAMTLLLALVLWRELARRSRAEAVARESEAGFRLLAEHASDMVSRVGPDGDRRYVSPASERLFGLPPDALRGRALLEITVPEDRPALEASMARLLAGMGEETTAFRVSHPQRGETWIEATARSLVDATTGTANGYVSIARDVTARRRTEAALAASEARYRLLADSTTDAITCLDLELRRTYASPASRSVYGCDPADMLGGTPLETMHPEDAGVAGEQFRLIASGAIERDRATYRVRHSDGSWIWVEVNIGLVRDTATRQPASIICAVRDVSERVVQSEELRRANAELDRLARHLARARDRAERASRTKSRFLAGMSHELRTPLNGILGYAQLLRRDGGLSSVQAQRVGAMLDAGTHLLEMINCVLDLSQIEAGQVELQPQAFAPDSLARACLDLVRPAADAKGLSLTLSAELDAAPQVSADPIRLRQIFLNLLGNAVKFTSRGSVDVRVRLRDGPALRIEVADTGPGIPAEHRHRLFQDFDRLAIDSGAVEGSGLGLALSARLASLMGGSVGHEENPIGGSVFSLEIPVRTLACNDGISTSAQPEAAAPAAPATSGLRVLVVDDVAMNRDIASSFLQASGYIVTCAEGGSQAIAQADANDFDAILMDVRMPGMDGLEATRRIRQIAGPRGRVPIVALTAQAFSEQVAECRQAGMDSHVAKPFTEAALITALAGAVSTSHTGSLPLVADRAPTPAAHGAELDVGSELPVLDAEGFASTAAFLSPGTVASYLETLAERSEVLLRGLRGQSRDSDLAGAAHMLAGSAGMFGFERLTAVARRFERALQTEAPDVPQAAAALIAALEPSLDEMRRHVSARVAERAPSSAESRQRETSLAPSETPSARRTEDNLLESAQEVA